jgi:hypothetical protein
VIEYNSSPSNLITVAPFADISLITSSGIRAPLSGFFLLTAKGSNASSSELIFLKKKKMGKMRKINLWPTYLNFATSE